MTTISRPAGLSGGMDADDYAQVQGTGAMEGQVAAQNALSVVTDSAQFWAAVIGAAGGIVGGSLTLAGNAWLARRQDKKANRLTDRQKKMLRRMLNKRGQCAGGLLKP